MPIRQLTKQFPFWLVTLSVVFGLTLPILIQEGMFQDAVLYSAVSHNLAIGFGNFWFPQYSTLNLEGIPSFHEQPPLVFGIQALFYKLLGDSMYVERFYTLLMIVLHILLIRYLWKNIFPDNERYMAVGWLPVLFWILIPVGYWSFRNNMIENTVSVFTLCSVIVSYKNVQSDGKNILLWLASGFFIFLATFSKGVPGFFPITFPFIYWLVSRKISFRECALYTMILTAVPLIMYGVFLLFPQSRESLSIYFYERLVRRVNSMPTADYRLEIVWRLFTELIPVMLFVILSYLLSGIKMLRSIFPKQKADFLLFLLVGLSGALPLTLTMVQKGWYMVPSFPFLAIAFAVLVVPVISSAIERIDIHQWKYKLFLTVSVLLFVVMTIFTISQKGKISREQDVISDVYQIGSVVPRFSTLTVPAKMYDQYDFVLQGFLVRYFNISISPYKQYEYFLKEKTMDTTIPQNYQKLDLKLSKHELYKTVGLPSQ